MYAEDYRALAQSDCKRFEQIVVSADFSQGKVFSKESSSQCLSPYPNQSAELRDELQSSLRSMGC